MTIKKLEVRMTPGAVKGEGNTITGLAAVYNSDSRDLGGFVERLAPGCFDASLASGSDCLCLFNHDPSQLLGRSASGTLQVRSTDQGLEYTVEAPDTTLGRDVCTLLARGDITGSSFAFFTNDDNWEQRSDGTTVRTVLLAQLMDVSPVTSPAYPAATASVRSLFPEGIPQNIEERLASHRTTVVEPDNSLELVTRELQLLELS
jgi:HK97 family phage prohead protease